MAELPSNLFEKRAKISRPLLAFAAFAVWAEWAERETTDGLIAGLATGMLCVEIFYCVFRQYRRQTYMQVFQPRLWALSMLASAVFALSGGYLLLQTLRQSYWIPEPLQNICLGAILWACWLAPPDGRRERDE